MDMGALPGPRAVDPEGQAPRLRFLRTHLSRFPTSALWALVCASLATDAGERFSRACQPSLCLVGRNVCSNSFPNYFVFSFLSYGSSLCSRY